MPRPEDLPDYRNPPIDEVAIAVQFAPIEGLYDEHARRFWQTMREEYPLLENRPRLEGPIEPVDPHATFSIDVSALGAQLPQGRIWLISASDDLLIQVQNTRFIQNWRHRETKYQRFEFVKDLFWNNFRKFRQFLDSENVQQPVVQQVEISYINWISGIPMYQFLLPAGSSEIHARDSIVWPEEEIWNARYLIGGEPGTVERLYAQCAPAARSLPRNERGFQFALVFRSAHPDGINDDEASSLMDSGRVTVVQAFTDLTTPSAQETWERFK
jgi:uncharacterized protein (TIGR04255 family)